MTSFILLIIVAYILGSIPFGYIVAKLKGVDITKTGSRATSTTNVSRSLGWRWAIVSGLLDLLKGVATAYLAILFLADQWQIVIVCLMPIIGHVFPVWLKFKGGKGAAPFFGAMIVFLGIETSLLFFLIWLAILFTTRIMSLTNIIFPWMLAVVLYFYSPFHYFVYGLAGAVLITFALRGNIDRLIKKTEPKVVFKW